MRETKSESARKLPTLAGLELATFDIVHQLIYQLSCRATLPNRCSRSKAHCNVAAMASLCRLMKRGAVRANDLS